MFSIILENNKNPYNLGGVMRAAYNFKADCIILIGQRKYKRSSLDTPNTANHIPIFKFNNWKDYKASISNQTLIHIGIELIQDLSTDIRNFIHPKSAAYIFGPEDGSISKEGQEFCKYILKIPTRSCLNLAVCTAIVMYDRLIKD